MDFETFVQESNQCRHTDELYKLFVHAAASLGFNRIIFSLLTPHPSIESAALHGVMHTYPGDWLIRYREKRYQQKDPVIKEVFRTCQAFSWEEMVKTRGLSREEKRIMREAENAGLCAGIGVPLHGVCHEVAAICFSTNAEKMVITPTLLAISQAYSYQFYVMYLKLMKPKELSRRRLTAREQEVLLWFAEGKSLSEVSDILGISIDTTRAHSRSIYEKLGVDKRTLAVLTALRNGLINPFHIDF